MSRGRYGAQPGRLTHAIVALHLGVKPRTVMMLRKSGRLTAEKVNGVWQYDPQVVENFARHYHGARESRVSLARRQATSLSVRAFKLFEEGCRSLREAVIRLKAEPTQVARLFDIWKQDNIEAHVTSVEQSRKRSAKRAGKRRLQQIADLLAAQAAEKAEKEDSVDAAFRRLAKGAATKKPPKPS